MVFPALTPDFKQSIGIGSGKPVVSNVKYEETEMIDEPPQIVGN